MSFPLRSPSTRVVRVVLALALLVTAGLGISTAVADTSFPPAGGAFTLTVTTGGVDHTYAAGTLGPTLPNMVDGQEVTIAAHQAPSSSTFARVRVRQCKNTSVNNDAQFNPQISNRCSSVQLGAGEPLAYRDSGPLTPGSTSAATTFKVGIGVAPDVVSQVTGLTLPGFTCDAANTCRLVVDVEVDSIPLSSNYLSFPIQFAGASTVPDPPTAVTATAGDAQAAVTWTAPASDGGSSITNYTVTSSPGGFTCTDLAAPLACTVSGLTNGQAYTFSVKATNVNGDSVASEASNSVTPRSGNLYSAIAPVRIIDSRPSSKVGPFSTPWVTQAVRNVTVIGGLANVPADAVAVAANVTVTNTTASSNLVVYPAGTTKPVVSNLNWAPGWTIPNAVTVRVGAGGQISVYNNNGNADVIIDIVGYYRPGVGAGFSGQAPVRIIDSRPASQIGPFNTPWATATTRDVTVTGGAAGVPADADSVVLNVTVTNTTASSNLIVWPKGNPKPTASNLNWAPGRTIPNSVTVKVGAGGQISVYNNNGNADVVIDVVGYFKAGTGVPFHPIDPVRVQDSRSSSQVGPYSSPWTSKLTRDVTVTGLPANVPGNAVAALMNFTVTATTASSNLVVYPAGTGKPTASNLNWAAGWTIPNTVFATLGTAGKVSVYNNNGDAHVIADVSGWFG